MIENWVLVPARQDHDEVFNPNPLQPQLVCGATTVMMVTTEYPIINPSSTPLPISLTLCDKTHLTIACTFVPSHCNGYHGNNDTTQAKASWTSTMGYPLPLLSPSSRVPSKNSLPKQQQLEEEGPSRLSNTSRNSTTHRCHFFIGNHHNPIHRCLFVQQHPRLHRHIVSVRKESARSQQHEQAPSSSIEYGLVRSYYGQQQVSKLTVSHDMYK